MFLFSVRDVRGRGWGEKSLFMCFRGRCAQTWTRIWGQGWQVREGEWLVSPTCKRMVSPSLFFCVISALALLSALMTSRWPFLAAWCAAVLMLEPNNLSVWACVNALGSQSRQRKK
jgi:hypothetical protein